MVVYNILALVDAVNKLRGEEGEYNPKSTRVVEVFIGEEFIGGDTIAGFSVSGCFRGRLIICDVMHRLKMKSVASAPVIAPKPEKASSIAPMMAFTASVPAGDYVGERPLTSLTIPVETQPALAQRVEALKEEKRPAKQVLGNDRVQSKFSGLDAAVAGAASEKLDIVLVLGATSGLVSKAMPQSKLAGVRFYGILPYGSPKTVGNLILEKGTKLSDAVKVLAQLEVFIGRKGKDFNIILVIFEGLTELQFNEAKQLKQLASARERLNVANAWADKLAGEARLLVFFDEPDAADLLQKWVTHAYMPRTFSLAHPYLYVGQLTGFIDYSPQVQEIEIADPADAAAQFIEWLREANTPYQGVEGGLGYPVVGNDSGAGSARLESFRQPFPNTQSQLYLLSADYALIERRFATLTKLCKVSEDAFAFDLTKKCVTVPIEFFNSTWVNKYVWELTGQQAPTQRAKRMAPLSALFALLDDDVFHNVYLLLTVLNDTSAPMHTYEAAQLVSGLGLLVKVEVIRRLKLEQAAAITGSYGERTVKARAPTKREVLEYALPLINHVGLVTAPMRRVIEHFLAVGQEKAGGGEVKRTPEHAPSEKARDVWALVEESRREVSAGYTASGPPSRGRGGDRGIRGARGRGGQQRGRGRGGGGATAPSTPPEASTSGIVEVTP